VLSTYEGNVQPLVNGNPTGNSFIGWGEQPYFSEFNFRGQMLFDAHFTDGNITYRAYKFPWVAAPQTPPSVVASTTKGRTTVYTSWNGATQVANWRVIGGSTPTGLATIGFSRRTGFETTIGVPGSNYVAVQALDAAGNILAQSPTVRSN
jgi:hypothetical protein